MAKPTFAAFNQGDVPKIACFNRATLALGVDLTALIAAMQAYVDNHVAPVWGTPANLVESNDYVPGAWAMVFLDDSDQKDALAYHDLTPDGLPQAKVFVRTTIANKDLVSVSASHELVEMLVDPAINLLTTGPDSKTVYAYESADPVEALSFPVNGIPMSDFVHPAYFEVFHKPGSVTFDHMKKVGKPFQILAGGYQIIFKGGKWKQVFGSAAEKKNFQREVRDSKNGKDGRKGHRSEQRKARRLLKADPKEIKRIRLRHKMDS